MPRNVNQIKLSEDLAETSLYLRSGVTVDHEHVLQHVHETTFKIQRENSTSCRLPSMNRRCKGLCNHEVVEVGT